jgi:hypothetical protein
MIETERLESAPEQSNENINDKRLLGRKRKQTNQKVNI